MFRAPPAPAPNAPELLRPRLVQHVLPFVELADEAGAKVDPLLAAVGLSRRALHGAKTRLPYYQLHWLVEQLIASSGDPEVGLRAAERSPFARMDVLGHMIQHFVQLSSDVLSVLKLLAHFGTYVCTTLRAEVLVDGERVIVSIVPTVEPPPELYDSTAGACCALIQMLAGPDVRPLAVRLPRKAPQRPERYAQFFAAPVAFGARQLELEYALSALRAPPREPSADGEAGLSTRSAHTAGALLAQVRVHVLARLGEGVPRLPGVARQLGLSARTLRRRLSEVRSSYAELVDEARRERAVSLAHRAELDVASLAELTGFTDASAFARAFRRWTGESPREFMRRVRGRETAAARG